MSNFRKFISMSAVAVLGVTNLLTPLSYANAATAYDSLTAEELKWKSLSFIMPNHDVYLYAITEANKYYVNYKGNDETSWTMPRKEFTYDTTWTLDENQFAKTWYTFTGWNTKAGWTGTGYEDKAKVLNWTTVDSGEVDIYAQWRANKYNITYNLNPGTGTSTPVHDGSHPNEATYNQDFTVTNPSRTWYAFSGWDITNMDSEAHTIGSWTSHATSASGVMDTLFENLRATSGTVNFLATWTRNKNTAYKVYHFLETFVDDAYPAQPEDTDSLSGTTDTNVTPAVKTYTWFTSPATQTKNIEADGSTEFTYKYTRNSYNLTITAGRWIASVKWTGTVNTTGGSANSGQSTAISFKYQEPVSLSFTLKSWYTWGTWSGYLVDDDTFTMPAFSTWKTAYATPIVYTITYDIKSGQVSAANPTTYTVESWDITLNNPSRYASKFAWWTGWVIGGAQLSSPTMTVTIPEGSIWNRSYTATWTCLSWYHLNWDQTECMADSDTEYKVEHRFQTLTWGNEYDLRETVTQTWETEKMTDAKTIAHEWFTVRTPIANDVITWNGTTKVSIRYERNSYTGTIANPSWVESTSITPAAEGEHPTGTAWTYKYGDTVTLSATLQDWYTFEGWTVTRNDTSATVTVTNSSLLTDATFTMPASSVTITPIVTKDSFNIHYELNSWHLVTWDTNPLTYNVETATFTLKNPVRDHSTFVWWSWTAISWTSKTVTIAKWSLWDRSYEAIWSCVPWYHAEGNSCVANEYNVVVDHADGEHGEPDTVVFTYDEWKKVDEPEQSWYDFIWWEITWMSGWVEHYIGTIIVTDSGATYTWEVGSGFMNLTTVESGTVTFTALWKARTDTPYVVYHYVKNVGSNVYTLSGTDHLSWETDADLTLANLKKTITGFNYSAWYLTGGTTRPTSGAVTETKIDKKGRTEIYLYYDRKLRNVYLSGDAHIDTLSGAGQYEYGASVTVEATVKTWYHFKTWQRKADSGFQTNYTSWS